MSSRGGSHAHHNGSRHPKPLFSEDEKVLCYEPDQKKAQVLYDSKVLEVVERKEGHGKLHYEYKIHFQGWNSSWDRYVREDNVLKDTDENRNLQRELQEKAQLMSKTSWRKKNKRKQTIMEKLKAATQAKDSGINGVKDGSRGESNNNHSSGTDRDTTDQDSSDDESESHQICLPDGLKRLLDDDNYYSSKKKMLVVLPARWSVTELLENYIMYVGRKEILGYAERRKRPRSFVPSAVAATTTVASAKGGKLVASPTKTPNNPSSRSLTDIANEDLIKMFQRINFSKKIVEDVRIMFDFLLNQILLYGHEEDQYDVLHLSDFFVNFPREEEEEIDTKVAASILTDEQKRNPDDVFKEPLPKRRKIEAVRKTSDGNAATTSKKSSEFKVHDNLTNSNKKSSEFKVPDIPTSSRRRTSEFKVPDVPPSSRRKSSEFKVPDVPPSSRRKSSEFKVPAVPTTSRRKSVEFKVPNVPTSSRRKSSEVKASEFPTTAGGKPSEFKVPDIPTSSRRKSCEFKIPDNPVTASKKTRELKTPHSTATASKNMSEKVPDNPVAVTIKTEKSDIKAPENAATTESSNNSNARDNAGRLPKVEMPRHKYICDLGDKCEYPWACEQLNNYMDELQCYQMLPEPTEEDHPSICYGVIHLLRLFVKMPDILSKTAISRKKLKTIVGEINNILVYLSEVENLVSDNEWFKPDNKKYVREFFEEINSDIQSKEKETHPAVNLRNKHVALAMACLSPNPTSIFSKYKRKINKIKIEGEPKPKKAKKSKKEKAPKPSKGASPAQVSAPLSPHPVLEVEGGQMGKVVERKRNQRRLTTGKMTTPTIIAGTALGVRKSLSVEELSRETLVAPNNPDLKTYSLRMHCRAPYK